VIFSFVGDLNPWRHDGWCYVDQMCKKVFFCLQHAASAGYATTGFTCNFVLHTCMIEFFKQIQLLYAGHTKSMS